MTQGHHPPPPPPPPWWGQAPPWFQQFFGHLQPPRIQRHGITGGTFKLDTPDAQWKGILRLDSQNPDSPWAANNDHDRTVYARTSPGLIQAGVNENAITLGVALRFTFGIGNAALRVIYNLPPNSVIHAAVTAQTVTVDAATIQAVFTGANNEITQDVIDEPTPILANEPPTIAIGILQNQALAMSPEQTPRRMVTVLCTTIAPKRISVPAGAQWVRVESDASIVPLQVYGGTEADSVPFVLNQDVPLGPSTWMIILDASAAPVGTFAIVTFGLGI